MTFKWVQGECLICWDVTKRLIVTIIFRMLKFFPTCPLLYYITLDHKRTSGAFTKGRKGVFFLNTGRQKDHNIWPAEHPRCQTCFMQPHIHASAQTRNIKIHRKTKAETDEKICRCESKKKVWLWQIKVKWKRISWWMQNITMIRTRIHLHLHQDFMYNTLPKPNPASVWIYSSWIS